MTPTDIEVAPHHDRRQVGGVEAFISELLEPALRLLAAVVVGALVGLNRDLYGKPAGTRLCALVSLGAGLATVVASNGHLGATDPGAVSRVIQGIVGGIGFLGAGVILHEGRENRVRNLTTAATIWVTAALGIACGVGAWRIATLGAILALVVLTIGLKIDRTLFGRLGTDDLVRDPSKDDAS
jgi:putative Mg2+ transporter-C (MgtC) family protein